MSRTTHWLAPSWAALIVTGCSSGSDQPAAAQCVRASLYQLQASQDCVTPVASDSCPCSSAGSSRRHSLRAMERPERRCAATELRVGGWDSTRFDRQKDALSTRFQGTFRTSYRPGSGHLEG